jgi:hypothetical protein
MDESTQDPREYRGGVREPEDAKGGQESWADTEGVVPREMIDDTGPEPTGEQDLKDAAMGQVTDHDHTGEAIDKSAGDQADATESDDSAESTTWHEDPTVSGRTGTGEA